MDKRTSSRTEFRWGSALRGIEPEVFVVGVLVVLLGLAWLDRLIPSFGLALAGGGAFLAVLGCGCVGMRSGSDLRMAGVPIWGVAAFFAVVWVAAGRLADPNALELWPGR
jgi:hypothetical protein